MRSSLVLAGGIAAWVACPVLAIPAANAEAGVVWDVVVSTAVVTVFQYPDGSVKTATLLEEAAVSSVAAAVAVTSSAVASVESSAAAPSSSPQASSSTYTPVAVDPIAASSSSSETVAAVSNALGGNHFAGNQAASSSSPAETSTQAAASSSSSSSSSNNSPFEGQQNSGNTPASSSSQAAITAAPSINLSGGDGSSGEELTVYITNAYSSSLTVAFGGGSSLHTKLAPGSDASWTLGTESSGNMGVAVVGVDNPVSQGSLVEWTYAAGGGPPLNLDVSFVVAYSVPVSCTAAEIILGCLENTYLEECPDEQQILVNGEVAACTNPNGGDRDNPSHPFVAGTCPAAYKYSNDDKTDKGMESSLISCCVGTSCPTVNYIGDAAKKRDFEQNKRHRHLHEHKRHIHRP